MTFQEAVQDAFSKYVQFNGRSSRAAYWYFYLFTIIVTVAAVILDSLIGIAPAFQVIVGLAIILPSLGLLWRRLHDTGRSGWWVLIQLIPLIGFIVMLVFLLSPSEGPNKYGEGPDGGPAVAAAPAPPAPPAPPTDGPQV